MSKIAIVTDTNSSMTKEETDALGIYLLPMPIIINGNVYFEGVDIEYDHFFELLAAGADVSTSQPSPDSVMKIWDEVLKTHDYIIHIPMSSALSSSYQTAAALAEDYGGKVFVIDNRRISISQRRSVLDAKAMADCGMDVSEIVAELNCTSGESSIYLAVNTLDLLKKSGRVTAAGAAFATILGINPVLQIQGGKLDAFAKARGMKRASAAMLKATESDLKSRFAKTKVVVDVAYSGDLNSALEWQKQVKEYFPDYTINLFRLPLSICCHVAWGVKAIGISIDKT